jgi:hypothetical protein
MLLEQFGGANGELVAAMQYSIQGLNCDESAKTCSDRPSGGCRAAGQIACGREIADKLLTQVARERIFESRPAKRKTPSTQPR